MTHIDDNLLSDLKKQPIADIIIVGGGAAGCMAALEAAPRRVVMICDYAPQQQRSASHWSKGGIAAAIADNDSSAAHVEDTIHASAAMADESIVQRLVADAPALIADLIAWGVRFDRDEDGVIELGREGRHRFSRILSANGDSFGLELMRALWLRIEQAKHIEILSGVEVLGLIQSKDAVCGVLCRDNEGHCANLYASGVVLATGGIGQLFASTTNPQGARGVGVAMAAKAGAKLVDLEFVQFHPTAIDVDQDPKPLASEAIRGAGAHLINDEGDRFMLNLHDFAELAPRDIVSRAMGAQVAAGHKVYLDCRQPLIKNFASRFPFADRTCKQYGIDPAIQPIPITPAAHYHMGGIAVDVDTGHTSVAGLWACGEVACTGMHGANRLASNSLLEALLSGRYCGQDLSKTSSLPMGLSQPVAQPSEVTAPEAAYNKLRQVMSQNLGIVREQDSMFEALGVLDQLARDNVQDKRFENMCLTAQLIARFALLRQESRGGHFREDFPQTSPLPTDLNIWARAMSADDLSIAVEQKIIQPQGQKHHA